MIIRDAVRRWPHKKRRRLKQRLTALPNEARVNKPCQAYDIRPMACRIFHSLNKSSCKRGRKALDQELYSALSDRNRAPREWLDSNGASAKVVAMPIWMKYHLNDPEDVRGTMGQSDLINRPDLRMSAMRFKIRHSRRSDERCLRV